MKTKPDRSDYEIWFTDWLDGTLDEDKTIALMIFLGENPDLREELEGLAPVMLKVPQEKGYLKKDNLYKRPEDLTDQQFEYLCIADLENDITPDQKKELNKITGENEDKRRLHDLFQLTRLKPPSIAFAGKGKLKRLTAGEKILRITLIGLSAAAAVILLILNPFPVPADKGQPDFIPARIAVYDTIVIDRPGKITVHKPAAGKSRQQKADPPAATFKEEDLASDMAVADLLPEPARISPPSSMTVYIPEEMLAYQKPSPQSLIDFNPGYLPPLVGDNRSNVDRFLARIFHEKIMKDTIMPVRPVERYDLAHAGINGLNKLLGWEMALGKNLDGNGEVRSYYFSSKLLKFKAPAKKQDDTL